MCEEADAYNTVRMSNISGHPTAVLAAVGDFSGTHPGGDKVFFFEN